MTHENNKRKKQKSKDSIALFLCKCGTNIADVIDIPALKERYEEMGIPVVEIDEHLCSEQGISDLITTIKTQHVDRIVIAGCSPLLHNELFSEAIREAGLNTGYLQMANIREHCSWVHYDDPEAATKKAAAIIDTSIAKIKDAQPILTQQKQIVQRTLVIGGGVSGLTAALELADAGIEVVIVEREGFLGGHMARWDKLFPTFDCSICILGPMMTRAARHRNINIRTLAEVVNITGNVGQYQVTVKQKARYVDLETCTGCNRCIEVCPVEVPDEYNHGLGKRKAMVRYSSDAVPIAPYIDMENCVGCQACVGVCEPKSLRFDEVDKTETFEVGAIVVATGFKPFDPTVVMELGYGTNPDVITSLELERLLNPAGPTGGRLVRPSNGKPPKRIVFVLCVGSRSIRFERPYCSRVCCTASIKEALQIKQQLPDSEIYIFYTDIRTFGKGQEELYLRAGREFKINFVRGAVGEVIYDPIHLTTQVRAEDTLLRRVFELEADLVVLMVGMEPDPSNIALSKLLKTPLDENGFFLELHPKLGPSSTHSKGVFLAGVAQGPKDIADAVAHAGLAASKVKTLLTSGEVILEACVPSFDGELCMACRLCEQICTPKAIKFHDSVPEINLAACRACGSCVAACPSGALDLPCLSNEQLENATRVAVISNPLRPAIVGFLCRWCAYSAADKAGTARLHYPPNIIPIQVPCTGRVSIDAILTAFAEGADGVAVLGCYLQDCHYRTGARYAKDRTDHVRETLEAIGIDGRRLYFGSASASEADVFADHVTKFVNQIIQLGPLGTELSDLNHRIARTRDAEQISGE